MILPIALGVLAIVIIIAVIVIGRKIYRNEIAKAQDNYAYYNMMGYASYDDKDYEAAAAYFAKALTYDEGAEDIDMMMYLRDCYVALGEDEKADEILQQVLEVNPYYQNAIILLITEYDENEDYEAIRELYDSVSASKDEELIALFDSFQCDLPKASYEGGEYSSDISVELKAEEGATIYCTTDGSDPTKAGTLYEDPFEMSEGSYTISFYAINAYGFASDVVTEEYTIQYKAPEDATISPGSGSYQTTSVQFITIGNVSKTGAAYYTTDGSTPTENSTKYTGPFELPIGNTTIKVIVIDDNGLSSGVTTATYTLTFVDKYTDEECQELVWAQLAELGYCDASTHLDASGTEYALGYYSKKTISDQVIYLYNLYVGPDKQTYYVGCDANEGTVYMVNGYGDEYILSILESYSAPTEESTAEASTGETMETVAE